jgi:hypothetical protein
MLRKTPIPTEAKQAIPGSGQCWDSFKLRIVSMGSKGVTWTTDQLDEKTNHKEIIALLLDGKLNQAQIAKIFKVSKTTILNRKKKAIKKELMDKKLNPTKKGKKFLAECEVDLSAYYKE